MEMLEVFMQVGRRIWHFLRTAIRRYRQSLDFESLAARRNGGDTRGDVKGILPVRLDSPGAVLIGARSSRFRVLRDFGLDSCDFYTHYE